MYHKELDLLQSEAVDKGDQRFTLTQRLVFDGCALYVVGADAEAANVFARTYAQWETTLLLFGSPIRPLHQWISNPLDVPLFEGATYEVAGLEPDLLTVRRMISPWGTSFPSEEHVIHATAEHCTQVATRTLDELGRIRDEVVFEDHRALGASVRRPWVVTRTQLVDGTSDGARVVVTVRILRAEPAGSLAQPAFDPEQLWQV